MVMEFQGKKTTHDFLSLYTKDSSSFHQQQQESTPSPPGLKTIDFLKPLEKKESAGPTKSTQVGPGDARESHVLPGGIGTYSISHVAGKGSLEVVKREGVTCDPRAGRKPEPDSGARGFGPYAGVAFTLWEASSKAVEESRGGQWPYSAPRAATSFGSLSSSRTQLPQARMRPMNTGRGFNDEDDEDDGFSRRELHRGDLTVKVDGQGGSGNDQTATTPRSKHSATEQRRRSKINDRFQTLSGLLPRTEQKRDKASLLLEVIEYIKDLHEKIHKYETAYPGWNEDNAKSMPWSNGQVPGENFNDPSLIMKNGPSGFMYQGKFDDNGIALTPAMLSTAHNQTESDLSAGISYKTMENSAGFTHAVASSIPLQPCSYASIEKEAAVIQPQHGLISDIDNLASQSQSQWLIRPSGPGDCSGSSDMLNGHEELAIDEGTISVSSVYSQNLLNTLNLALENSGIDLSQANVSVQINLGKRAASKRHAASTPMSSAKDLGDPLLGSQGMIEQSRLREKFERGTKRRKLNN